MRTGSLGAIVVLCACFAIAMGDETVSLTVANLTPHVVSVVVEERTYPAVAPGAEATYRTGAPATVSVNVSYVPGQGVEGHAQRAFHLSSYQPATTSGTTVYWACTTGGTITAPATGGPVMWKVTPDTLAVR